MDTLRYDKQLTIQVRILSRLQKNKNMKNLLERLQDIKTRQSEAMTKMAKENCNDIYSVLRAKDLAVYIIELQVKIDLLTSLIIEQTGPA